MKKKCQNCGEDFNAARSTSKYCSRPCSWANNGGQNKKEVSWWKNSKGYIEGRIWIDESTQIRVKQHRWVAEGILGRPLRIDEDVHHINGIKDDNRPENLSVLMHGDHTKVTNSEREYRTGYKLKISQEERNNRSMRAVNMRLAEIGRKAISTKKGESA